VIRLRRKDRFTGDVRREIATNQIINRIWDNNIRRIILILSIER